MDDGMVSTTGAPLGSARGRTVATSSDEVGGKYASLSIRILRSIGAISTTRAFACSMVSVKVCNSVSLPSLTIPRASPSITSPMPTQNRDDSLLSSLSRF